VFSRSQQNLGVSYSRVSSVGNGPRLSASMPELAKDPTVGAGGIAQGPTFTSILAAVQAMNRSRAPTSVASYEIRIRLKDHHHVRTMLRRQGYPSQLGDSFPDIATVSETGHYPDPYRVGDLYPEARAYENRYHLPSSSGQASRR
jgi:hypothetical protein